MNPHDPAVRPGAHLVAAELGIEDPWELATRHPARSPLDIVGRLVATAAHEVDDLHADLTRAAQSAIKSLEPVSRGQTPQLRGLLGAIGPQLELLATRRETAYRHLTSAASAYRQLRQSVPRPTKEPGTTQERTTTNAPDQNAPRASEPISSDVNSAAHADHRSLYGADPLPTREELLALEEIACDRVLLTERVFRSDTHVTTGSGARISTATLEAVQERGWVDRDATSSLFSGQKLSLTTTGDRALRAGCSQDSRATVAPRRRTPNTQRPSPPARPSGTPVPGPTEPTRSR